jgi:heavy metal sensor kinase
MIFNSIRWRVQAWHGVILLAVLTGFGLTAYNVVRENVMRRVDKELEQRFVFAFFRPPPSGPPPQEPGRPGPPASARQDEKHRWERGDSRMNPAFFRARFMEGLSRISASEDGETNSFYYFLWEADGSLAAQSTNAPAEVPKPDLQKLADNGNTKSSLEPGRPASGPRGASFRTRGELREAYNGLPFETCLLIGRSIAPELATMRQVALWLCAAGTGILALGLAGGWWLAARAIAPVDAISATALKISGGDLSQRINAADTESELGRLAAVLNSTFARLEAAFAHQVRFTSDASHELRTPLSVILSQTQTVLARERGPAEYRHALEACQRAAQRMRKLTESLLILARLDAGQESMKREQVDLAKVAQECVDLVRPLGAERGIEFQMDPGPAQCHGDMERIGQVVTNLLANAIQFNKEGGKVAVLTFTEDHTAVLRVTDTGEGIPATDIPHIFERFYRVDKSRTGAQGRSGLGLAISKAIVDAHSGTIAVTSQPGVGSTFTVKLPAA